MHFFIASRLHIVILPSRNVLAGYTRECSIQMKDYKDLGTKVDQVCNLQEFFLYNLMHYVTNKCTDLAPLNFSYIILNNDIKQH